jgi:hypothetical protein
MTTPPVFFLSGVRPFHHRACNHGARNMTPTYLNFSSGEFNPCLYPQHDPVDGAVRVAYVLIHNVGSCSSFMYIISPCYLCYIPAQRPVPAGTLGVKIKNEFSPVLQSHAFVQ